MLAGFSSMLYSNPDPGNLDINVSILKEIKGNNYDPIDIQDYSHSFKPVTDSLSLHGGNYWVKIEAAGFEENQKAVLLDINIKAEGLSFFQPYQNSVEKIGKTHHKHFFTKPVIKTRFSRWVPVNHNKHNIYYLHVVKAPKQVFTTQNIDISKTKHYNAHFNPGFFSGFKLAYLLIVIIFCIYFYYILKEEIYLYFIVYIFCHAVYFVSNDNILGIHILPGYYELNYLLRAIQPLGIFFYIVFVFKALKIKMKSAGLLRKFIGLYLIISLAWEAVVVVLAFVSYYHFTSVLYLTNQLQAIGGLIIVFSFAHKYKGIEKYYLAGVIILSICAFTSTFQSLYTFSSNWIFEIGVMLEVLLFSFGLYYQTRQLLKEKAKIEALNLQLSESIKQKEKEIIAHSIQLAKNKDTQEKINSQLAQMKKNGEVSNSRLNELLTSFDKVSNHKHWDEFQFLFNQLHDGFFNKLANKYPKLSNTEVRICCFLKMGMTSKEISAFTNQTVKSIEVARSRIRKKLSLQQKESLTNRLQLI
jgi:DNA-binding NarL/FixJ family response regulator